MKTLCKKYIDSSNNTSSSFDIKIIIVSVFCVITFIVMMAALKRYYASNKQEKIEI